MPPRQLSPGQAPPPSSHTIRNIFCVGIVWGRCPEGTCPAERPLSHKWHITYQWIYAKTDTVLAVNLFSRDIGVYGKDNRCKDTSKQMQNCSLKLPRCKSMKFQICCQTFKWQCYAKPVYNVRTQHCDNIKAISHVQCNNYNQLTTLLQHHCTMLYDYEFNRETDSKLTRLASGEKGQHKET